MGEARRRKLAGTYPNPDDPMAKLRRFWCGRSTNAGPVEDFRVPEGIIAITLDVKGTAPSTCMIDAGKLVDVMDQVHRMVFGLNYYAGVRFIAREFVKARQTGDDATFESIGLMCLWSALHHPQKGAEMRDAVSEMLRRDGKAHISWCFSPEDGLVMGLGDRFMDLEGLAARMPGNTVMSYRKPHDGAEPQQN